ncbi:MAG TPA: TonB-dependent receptor [Chitinophagaceae bacterium]|nr:TonB-dependent receptor [Chitinophagaceae bacterium]
MFREFRFMVVAMLISCGVFSQDMAHDTTVKKNSVTDTIPEFIRPEMDEIVVSGTMRPVRKLESPVAVEVYSSQFLKKNPVPSIFEALQMVNGVRPQLNCNVCNTGDIHINGLDGPYTMVTIDGMPIVSGLSTVYGLFGIPNQMIDRVEVVKGPASGLYGSEAVGGLINIITKSPLKAPLVSADLMATSWQEYQADLSTSFRVGKRTRSMLGVHMYHYDHPVDHNNDHFTDMTLQQRFSIFSKWSFERKFSRLAEMGIRLYHENRWGGEMNWNDQFRGSDSIYGESIYTKRAEFIGRYQLPLDERVFFSWSYTYHDQDSYYGKTPFLARQQIGFGQLTWDKAVDRHNLLAGLAMRYNYMDDNTTATYDPVKLGNKPEISWLPGIFIQDEIRLSNRHDILIGLRYDHHSTHGNIFTPRVAWKWKTFENGVFRLNAGTGFRVVNIFTEDHAALTGARTVEIKEEIKPEQSYNINLNYNHRLLMDRSFINLDASVWYTRFSNQIIPDYDTDPNKIIYQNLDGYSVSKGVSLNSEYNYENRLRLMLGATLQDVFVARAMQEKTRPVLVEKWSGVWTFSYTFPKYHFTIDYTGNIYGPMRLPLLGPLDPRPSESPVWSVQNLQITKRLKGFEIYFGVKNILNWTPTQNVPFIIARAHDPFDKNVQYDASGKVMATPENPYALSFDPTYMYAPNQGRRLFMGLRFTLKQPG